MIDIRLSMSNIGKHFSSGQYWISYQKNNNPNDRPYSKDNFGSIRYTLIDPLHDWLKDNNIKYSLREERTTIISFYHKADAMLFKLTWM